MKKTKKKIILKEGKFESEFIFFEDKEREKRLSLMDQVFKPEISKFEVRWERI